MAHVDQLEPFSVASPRPLRDYSSGVAGWLLKDQAELLGVLNNLYTLRLTIESLKHLSHNTNQT